MRYFIFLFIVSTGFVLPSKEVKYTPAQYIEMYKDDAITEMKRAGVPASITLAQGMLESGYGNSELARKANNHFGIKCHSDWNGPIYRVDDDKKDECFRKYKSVLDSYKDHSDFLKGKKRYASLFELKITDYKGWCKGLKAAGYATNPKYANLLIDMIERYNLNEFDDPKAYEKQKKSKEEVTKTSKRKNKKPLINTEEGSDDFEIEYQPKSDILVSENWIKYVEIKPGDTFYSISNKYDISLRRLYKYNECNADRVLSVGDRIYLQPKKRRAKIKHHVLTEGEDVYQISQLYGVKLKHIFKKNNWTPDYSPKVGETIILR